MTAMESLHDLIEDAKLRALWWIVCILLVSYLLSLTSQSMWANIPIAIFFIASLRTLLAEVDFRRRVRPARQRGYLAHLHKKQLTTDYPILSTSPSAAINWTRKIDSPVVEAALDEFIGMVLKDFVVDLWYSSVTPDKEAPELIKAVVKDVCGEIGQRVKEINLVDLLTWDMVKLIGSHLDLYRRNQSAIGVELMATLSLDARDERLKHHLFVSRELHPALISSECEYKVLQELMGGVLAVVLRQQEVQCPLIRCMSRELLTCLVIQPLVNLIEPGYINELIELIFLATKDKGEVESVNSHNLTSHQNDHAVSRLVHSNGAIYSGDHGHEERLGKETAISISKKTTGINKNPTSEVHLSQHDAHPRGRGPEDPDRTCYQKLKVSLGVNSSIEQGEKVSWELKNSKSELKRSRSISSVDKTELGIYELSSSDLGEHKRVGCVMLDEFREESETNAVSEGVIHNESSAHEKHAPKIKCRVVGAYFEKTGSKSFAVYSIAVTSNGKENWFVRRRYRNFERLHRHLKDIPNYSLHLPPKRFLSSSIDDYLVHQRCILLNKYLQELLSIANVAEQHEVWDFLSASSKNYSFGKPTSIMKTLAVNVDDAMDGIVCQSKGVSDGLCRKVIGSPDSSSSLIKGISGISMDEVEQSQHLSYSQREQSHSESEDEDQVKGALQDEAHSSLRVNGWHLDTDLAFKQFSPRVVKRYDNLTSMESRGSQQSEFKSESCSATESVVRSALLEDPVGVPPEWTPPNLSVPLLDLVDTIFQLKQRGWLRRHVFWMSKQVLQLVMEDAIDDWLLRQIHWLQREDIVAEGIKWLQDVLWPEGTFFRRVNNNRNKLSNEECLQKSGPISGSSYFEMQREAARRANDIKKKILGGAPATLVSLIGHKQFHRCAEDVYYFLQSTTCVKQLTYSVLELLLVSIFPELKNLILNIHQKACYRS